MFPRYSVLVMLAALATVSSVRAEKPVGQAAAAPTLGLHCECLDEANRFYDPDGAFDHPGMPNFQAEVELRRWAYVEDLYASCMRRNGSEPRANVFPYGVSDYPDGPEFHPRECRGTRSRSRTGRQGAPHSP